MKYIKQISLAVCLLMTVIGYTPAGAADKLEVAVNQSRILTFSGVERVAVANPEIADVVVVSGTEVMLIGKASGVTNLHIWAAAGIC